MVDSYSVTEVVKFKKIKTMWPVELMELLLLVGVLGKDAKHLFRLKKTEDSSAF